MKSLPLSLSTRCLSVFFAGLVLSAVAVADHNTPEALDARTAPVGKLNVVADGGAIIESAAAQSGDTDGKTVYNTTCVACHGAGIAGAPKTGDAEVWVARIAQGMTLLVAHAIDGFQGETGVMIAKGGNAALSDDEVAAAVKYMVEQSQ